jgi:hypothetical protein
MERNQDDSFMFSRQCMILGTGLTDEFRIRHKLKAFSHMINL